MTDEQIRSALEPHLEDGISVKILRGENDKGEASVRVRLERGTHHTGWARADETAFDEAGESAFRNMAGILTSRLARKEKLNA